MTPDPPLRRDGRCAQCRGPRRYAKPSRYAGEQAVLDVFCSATCCRVWHGGGVAGDGAAAADEPRTRRTGRMISRGEPMAAAAHLPAAKELTATQSHTARRLTPRGRRWCVTPSGGWAETGSPLENLQLVEWDGELPVPYGVIPF